MAICNRARAILYFVEVQMDALRASYGDTDSDSDSDFGRRDEPPAQPPAEATALPPPPLSLLQPPNSLVTLDSSLPSNLPNRVRSFPHVDGNYAVHIYIPVTVPLVSRKEISPFLRKVAAVVRDLHVVDVDIPLINLLHDEQKFEQIVLGKDFHVSLGRTVPIRVHQRDSVVAMLRQRLHSRRRYRIDFNKWVVFVNDEATRTFLSMDVTTRGLAEIRKQIEYVNEVYKLHNLPEFYKDPRPHISVAWAVGDVSESLKRAIGEEVQRDVATRGLSRKRIFTCPFGGISCRIGNKTFEICKAQEE